MQRTMRADGCCCVLARLTPGVCFLQAMLGGNDHPGAADVKKILGSGAWLEGWRPQCCCCRCSWACPSEQGSRDPQHRTLSPQHQRPCTAAGSGRVPLHVELAQLSSPIPCLLPPPHRCAVGVEADAADVERLLKELEGKDIKELIAAGEGVWRQLREVVHMHHVCVCAGGCGVCGDLAMWGAQGRGAGYQRMCRCGGCGA